MVLNELSDVKQTRIPMILRLAAVLRYFGQGSYQQMIAKDAHIAMGRSTMSKTLTTLCDVLENKLCPNWIQFDRNSEEIAKCKRHFYETFKIPGVIGCIDGTHIKIKAPPNKPDLYFCRKGYYSINAMIICDYAMNILAINARRPGKSHDSFIWNLSDERQDLIAKYQNGDKRSWLLGDGGYGVEPFLLTPYRNPQPRTAEHTFNTRHASARNIVERVIGVLKSRFRCLLDTMSYEPNKTIQIINICCALHNISRAYNIREEPCINNYIEENILDVDEEASIQPYNQNLVNEGIRIRDEIARSF